MNDTLVKSQYDIRVNAEQMTQQANESLVAADASLQQTEIVRNETISTTQQASNVLTGNDI